MVSIFNMLYFDYLFAYPNQINGIHFQNDYFVGKRQNQKIGKKCPKVENRATAVIVELSWSIF